MAAIELLRVRHGDAFYLEAADLRRRVLYEPFGIEWVTDGADDLDPATVHVVAVRGGAVIGYGRLVYHAGEPPLIRQLAVDEGERRQGVGTSVMEELLEIARSAGDPEVWLEARLPAIGFYEGLGFVRVGQEYATRTGILHVRMLRALAAEE